MITFNDHPMLAVKFTRDVKALAGGLAGLKAERGTALYDSLIFSFYTFNGLKGRRALLLLSDGRDEGSRFSFEEALEFARRAGVTVYAIGLGDDVDKRKLARIAEETGGRAFFPKRAGDLAAIYAGIAAELRSQYLIAYQSTTTRTDLRVSTAGERRPQGATRFRPAPLEAKSGSEPGGLTSFPVRGRAAMRVPDEDRCGATSRIDSCAPHSRIAPMPRPLRLLWRSPLSPSAWRSPPWPRLRRPRRPRRPRCRRSSRRRYRDWLDEVALLINPQEKARRSWGCRRTTSATPSSGGSGTCAIPSRRPRSTSSRCAGTRAPRSPASASAT